MLTDITLGQFFPGNSIIHRVDARVKLILTVIYLSLVFTAASEAAFLFVFAITTLLIALSRISVKVILKGLKPIIFVIVLTALINIFSGTGAEGSALVSFWGLSIYGSGIRQAVLMALRLVCLIAGTSVLISYTTSPVELTDAMERLLSPLKKLKIPVHDFSMMMTIALRFIPTLIEETDKIMSAQKARGADFESGGLLKRIKAMIPILIPLFVSAFRRADELSQAMECRCYRGGEGRTRMKIMKAGAIDFLILAAAAASLAAVLFLNRVIFYA